MDAHEFKRIRNKLGFTQADAARVLGFAGPTVISNIETGFRKPTKLVQAVLGLLDGLPPEEARSLANQLALQNRKRR